VAENVSEVRETAVPHVWIRKERAAPGLARSCGGRVIASLNTGNSSENLEPGTRRN
jgi:hypothetical protein